MRYVFDLVMPADDGALANVEDARLRQPDWFDAQPETEQLPQQLQFGSSSSDGPWYVRESGHGWFDGVHAAPES